MSESLNLELEKMTAQKDETAVKRLLQEGADPNFVGENSTAIHTAAFHGADAILKVLIEAGANPNLKNRDGFAPIHWAASQGHIKTCEILIRNKADINAKTSAGGTALHVAASSGHSKICKILLAAGADINAADNMGSTPLSIAVGLNQKSVVTLLLSSGADTETVNANGQTPLLMGLDMLNEVGVKDWEQETRSNHTGETRIYSIRNNYFTFKDGTLVTPVVVKDQKFLASKSWVPQEYRQYLTMIEIVKLLLKHNADPDKTDKRMQNAFSYACRCGDAHIIKLLYSKTKNKNTRNFLEAGNLHLAALSGRTDGLKWLLSTELQTEINSVDSYGWTPLHYAADLGEQAEIIELLKEAGADTSIKSTKARGEKFGAGITAYEIAVSYNDSEKILRLLA
jgi:ankyrin repeat protein